MCVTDKTLYKECGNNEISATALIHKPWQHLITMSKRMHVYLVTWMPSKTDYMMAKHWSIYCICCPLTDEHKNTPNSYSLHAVLASPVANIDSVKRNSTVCHMCWELYDLTVAVKCKMMLYLHFIAAALRHLLCEPVCDKLTFSDTLWE